MSVTLLKFARSFVNERLSAVEFANAYIELWRIERDDNLIDRDSRLISAVVNSIFSLSDLWNPDEDREEYEIDEDGLRLKIAVELSWLPPGVLGGVGAGPLPRGGPRDEA